MIFCLNKDTRVAKSMHAKFLELNVANPFIPSYKANAYLIEIVSL